MLIHSIYSDQNKAFGRYNCYIEQYLSHLQVMLAVNQIGKCLGIISDNFSFTLKI